MPHLNTLLPIGTQKLLSEKHVAVSMLSEKNGVIKFGLKNVII